MHLERKTSFALSSFFVFSFTTAIIFIGSFFIFTNLIYADNTVNYAVSSGTDASSGTPKSFTSNDIQKLSISDSETGNGIDRMRSDKWPDQNQYEEDRYIEFIFSSDIPEDAILSEVKIIHEFQRSAALAGAKIEVWDGENFVDQDGTTLGTTNEDHTDIIDITSILDTAEKINNTKIRFLAYRASITASGTTTGHDFISLSVSYSLPELPEEEGPVPPPEPINNLPTFITEDIIEDTVWALEGSPYVLEDSIVVWQGATLTIEPGVIVKVDPSSGGMTILGSISAEGTSSDNIYFTSLWDDSIGGDTNEDGDATVPILGGPGGGRGLFGGITFYNSEEVSLKNSSISFSVYGFDFWSMDASISNIKGRNNKHDLNILEGSDIALSGGDFYGSLFESIYLVDSDFTGDNIIVDNTQNWQAFVSFNSNLSLTDSIIQNMKAQAIGAEGPGIINLERITIKNTRGVIGYDGIIFNIKDSVLDNTSLITWSGTTSNLDNVIIKNSEEGIADFGNSIFNITDSKFINNNIGIKIYSDTGAPDSIYSISNSTFSENIEYGAYNESSYVLNFENNWWGDASGPYHETLNPDGLGDAVSDNVLFIPWCLDELCSPPPPLRNPVIIIPGITGTYLFKDNENYEEIWPNIFDTTISLSDDFLNYLVLDVNGVENPNQHILLGDIIRGITYLGVHVFDKLIDELTENGYVENTDLFVFPYDWRKSSTENAVALKNKINFVLNKTEAGNIDLVAHSMGGIIAKKYIADNEEHFVDKMIFLGTPHLGASKAFKALMYGDNMGNFVLNTNRMKVISQNMPAVYELLPSEKYILENGYYVVDARDRENIPKNLDYNNTKDFMIEKGRNPLMFPFAENLHQSIDDLDLSEINTYNFIGCGTKTIGGITAKQKRSWLGLSLDWKDDYDLKYVNGDETVPLVSASGVVVNNKYFAKNISHGDLPSVDGVKQSILAILTGDDLPMSENILNDVSNCNVSGRVVSVHSPVELHIYDEIGNHTGPKYEGNFDYTQDVPDIEYGIEGVQYDVIDGEKFAFLPDGNNYKIIIKATDTGGFNFQIKDQDKNDNINAVYDWTLIPLQSLQAQGEIWIGPDYLASDYFIKMDQDGDGDIDENFPPSYDGTDFALQSINPPLPLPPTPPDPPISTDENPIRNTSGGTLLLVNEPEINTFELLTQIVAEMEKESIEKKSFNQENLLAGEDRKKEIIIDSEIENIFSETNILEKTEDKQEEIPLTASVSDSGIKLKSIWFFIIIGTFVLSLLARRYIKV